MVAQRSQPKWQAALVFKLLLLPIKWSNSLISGWLLKCGILHLRLLPLNPGTQALDGGESGL